jgi:hypothetical protein
LKIDCCIATRIARSIVLNRALAIATVPGPSTYDERIPLLWSWTRGILTLKLIRVRDYWIGTARGITQTQDNRPGSTTTPDSSPRISTVSVLIQCTTRLITNSQASERRREYSSRIGADTVNIHAIDRHNFMVNASWHTNPPDLHQKPNLQTHFNHNTSAKKLSAGCRGQVIWQFSRR